MKKWILDWSMTAEMQALGMKRQGIAMCRIYFSVEGLWTGYFRHHESLLGDYDLGSVEFYKVSTDQSERKE
jgi:hypothetical protein